MGKKISFEVEDVDIVDELDDSSQFSIARIHAFSSGKNRHDLFCDEETLRRTAVTLGDKPIVFDIDRLFGDFGGHVDEPFIAGFIVSGTEEFERLPDGRLGLFATAKIWKWYSRGFVDIVERDNGRKKVSVEMELNEVEEDEATGLGKMVNFIYTAVCILGEFVTEASPGANMQMVRFSKAPVKEEYFKKFARYEDLDFSIPESVRKNAAEGLELRNRYNRGGTAMSIGIARHLSKNEFSTPQKVRQIHRFFEKNSKMDLSDKESDGWISWMMWGGNSAVSWAGDLCNMMDYEDEQVAVYFQKEDVMPYSSMKDVNPAIKGIEPPVTLAQANQIAKEAEGIGSDSDKNGWAIAISNFKKTHKVEDGRWVKKKEKMSKKEEESSMSIKKTQEEVFSEDVEEEVTTFEEDGEEKEKPENTEEMEAEPEEKPEDTEEMALEKTEDMAEEEPEEEESDEEDEPEHETEMSDENTYKRVGDALEMLSDVENYGEMMQAFEAKEIKLETVFDAMLTKMSAMNESIVELKGYKENVEKKEFDFQVDVTLKEVEAHVPAKELEALKEEAGKFSLENIDGWKNLVRAKAFEFSKESSGEKDLGGRYDIYSLHSEDKVKTIWD